MNPIINKVGTIFIPVKDIQSAREWYCNLLDRPLKGEILFNHLYVLPMDGTGIVLDSKIYSEDNLFKVPLFHFNCNDIEQAYRLLESKNIEILTGIEHGHWFNFKDLDGNVLMICKC